MFHRNTKLTYSLTCFIYTVPIWTPVNQASSHIQASSNVTELKVAKVILKSSKSQTYLCHCWNSSYNSQAFTQEETWKRWGCTLPASVLALVKLWKNSKYFQLAAYTRCFELVFKRYVNPLKREDKSKLFQQKEITLLTKKIKRYKYYSKSF